MSYGKIIPDLKINGKPAPYGVVNDRSIRATAGIMFVVGITAFFLTQLLNSRTPLYIVVPIFWLEFLLKTVMGPQWSLFGILGDWLVRKQEPEWVGAIQKRFAWGVGLLFSSTMILLALIMGVKGWIPLSICATCLSFMWLESAAGICVGCKMYGWMISKKIIPAPKYRPVCPGGACSIR
ncbi:DUF4395 domain-containing protein [Candidatus Peregrinibacteria bacterium]|jgi:hypothetical protein|nr:DUF4395 domain-containing protein [Candidatus Peregrinibacteria bacterium]MBT3598388.1 DUF4395 domain-containing protein [Candidatus Peregrinibacteria bacterium]MBT4367425.1 DUF4395 domain-containing protein [Candidatus Peregrinibacteria bacterium]MBT4585659.1 DUF4395 domain-containing protein [Candidatus Peregrinibacteria bacterium]MBT6730425.1 DUF4395 domain-containing protein [Candidatus Peregrinibacteria bacterium]